MNVTERAIFSLAAARKIAVFNVGEPWRFPRAEFDRWISQQSAPAKAVKPTEGVRASKAHKTTSRRWEAR